MDRTLFIYPEGVDGSMEDKFTEVSEYIDGVDMRDFVTVSHDPFKDTIAITGPDELLFEIYQDCVYVGEPEGIDEGFQNSVG